MKNEKEMWWLALGETVTKEELIGLDTVFQRRKGRKESRIETNFPVSIIQFG